MGFLNQSDIDFLQSLFIGSTASEVKSLEERVKRLEKIVYVLCLQLNLIPEDSKTKKTNKLEKKPFQTRHTQHQTCIGKHVVLINDCIFGGKTIKKGTKGIIDNKITSSNGVFYFIKLDDSEQVIKVFENDFE